MIWNYLKIAVRNLKRNKGFSFINILGLSIGMASAILIMLWISYSCMILFFGTEFTRQNAMANGRNVQPNENAEKDKERKQAEKKDHKSEG